MKTPTKKARALLLKLSALAERGIGGEQTQAAARLAKLKAAYDFALPDEDQKDDLFAGVFRPSPGAASSVCLFEASEIELSSFVKWCIEGGSGVPCSFSGQSLRVQATGATADKLSRIALQLADGFRTLTRQFCERCPEDSSLFARGLLDGVLNDERHQGEPLPPRRAVATKMRGKKRLAVASSAKLNIHPYSLALPLGKQLRFSVSIEKISGELAEQLAPRQIAA